MRINPKLDISRRPPAINLAPRPNFLKAEVKPAANPQFAVRAFADNAEITIFAEIGGPSGVTAENINASLKQFDQLPVTMKINSYGGDAFEGVAIYNLLRAHPAPITAQILGIAASAASIIAMAADRIEMARNSQMMIHQAWMGVIGNEQQMTKAAAFLHDLDRLMAGTYAARSGQPVPDIQDMMNEETWLNADQAIELDLADALLDADAGPALKPQTEGPRSKRELETALRNSGLSKVAAMRVASAGWSALEPSGEQPAMQQFIDRITNATTDLRKELKQ